MEVYPAFGITAGLTIFKLKLQQADYKKEKIMEKVE
jgi:hypothetical protein